MAVGEWDERVLCPDGGCVGVIGADGLCKVCGRAATNWGNERDRGLQADAADDDEDEDLDDEDDDDDYEDDDSDDPDDDDDDDGEDDDPGPLDALDPSTPSLIGAPAEWNERRLCKDGACIGVIGPDGICKVCGKPAGRGTAAAPAAPAGKPPAGVTADDAEGDDAEGDDDEGDDDEGDDDDDDDELAAAAADLAAVASPDAVAKLPTAEDLERKLCPDGACVGVIGADGHCKLCGKAAA
ncbi:MAG: hypothetical protein IPQ07_04395 [Myxococcales bacterium]|nr:hypothetical protein [Myxococcales bacterium]